MIVSYYRRDTGAHAFTGDTRSSKAGKIQAAGECESTTDLAPSSKHIRQADAWVLPAAAVAEKCRREKCGPALAKARQVIFRYDCEKAAGRETHIPQAKYLEWCAYVADISAWDGTGDCPVEPA